MNYFLLVFLVVLITYSSVFVVLDLKFYKESHNSIVNMWYIPSHREQSYWQNQTTHIDRVSFGLHLNVLFALFLFYLLLAYFCMSVVLYF